MTISPDRRVQQLREFALHASRTAHSRRSARAATKSSCTTAHRSDHGQRSGHNPRSEYGANSSITPHAKAMPSIGPQPSASAGRYLIDVLRDTTRRSADNPKGPNNFLIQARPDTVSATLTTRSETKIHLSVSRRLAGRLLAGRKGFSLAWRVAKCARIMGALVAIAWPEVWICCCGACTNDQPGANQCRDHYLLHLISLRFRLRCGILYAMSWTGSNVLPTGVRLPVW